MFNKDNIKMRGSTGRSVKITRSVYDVKNKEDQSDPTNQYNSRRVEDKNDRGFDTDFFDHYQALRKFLKSNTGKNWDKIYSTLKNRFKSPKHHVLFDDLDYLVKLPKSIKYINKIPHEPSSDHEYHELYDGTFYIDQQNILRQHSRIKDSTKPKFKKGHGKYYKTDDKYLWYINISDVWYLIQFREARKDEIKSTSTPYSHNHWKTTYLDPKNDYDHTTYRQIKSIFTQNTLIPIRKHRLNDKELKEIGLENGK